MVYVGPARTSGKCSRRPKVDERGRETETLSISFEFVCEGSQSSRSRFNQKVFKKKDNWTCRVLRHERNPGEPAPPGPVSI